MRKWSYIVPTIRELRIIDVEGIYSWMNDPEVINAFTPGKFPISKDAIELFIKNSWADRENVHLAIVDDDDKYAGTVSLKNIDFINKNAEYAIVIHKNYWRKGYSKFGTDQIVDYGFRKIKLNKIYLNVLSSNWRGIEFYEKYGFEREGVFREHIYVKGQPVDLIWYCLFNRL